jgi:hypothetical protein
LASLVADQHDTQQGEVLPREREFVFSNMNTRGGRKMAFICNGTY